MNEPELCRVCGLPEFLHEGLVVSMTFTDGHYVSNPKHEFVLTKEAKP